MVLHSTVSVPDCYDGTLKGHLGGYSATGTVASTIALHEYQAGYDAASSDIPRLSLSASICPDPVTLKPLEPKQPTSVPNQRIANTHHHSPRQYWTAHRKHSTHPHSKNSGIPTPIHSLYRPQRARHFHSLPPPLLPPRVAPVVRQPAEASPQPTQQPGPGPRSQSLKRAAFGFQAVLARFQDDFVGFQLGFAGFRLDFGAAPPPPGPRLVAA